MTQKPTTYYSPLRRDVAALLPSQISRSLEIGCGTGSTSAWIRQTYGACVTGVELLEVAAREAEKVMDRVVIGDVEELSLPFAPDSFDLVLCLDVLEHLIDPWETVAKLTKFMKPGASFVASIPNIQHYSILLNLLRGRWNYTGQGLMDKTHLRFFVRSTAVALLEDAGLKVSAVETNMDRTRVVDRCTFGLFRGFFAYQYLIHATLCSADGENSHELGFSEDK